MADVYLAVSRTTNGLEKLAVIKRLRPDIGEDPEEVAHFKGMFWDEARLAMLLNHSNVVRAYDACEEGSSLYLVMEYIEGQPLNSVLRELARLDRYLTPVQSALIMSEVLAGLHYAHELTTLSGDKLEIVHRDVSPQNILLGYDGSIRLLDFGVAMATTRSTETRAGVLKGKARYMAPEQVVKKGTVTRQADIYSAGVVLWELIARRKMVPGANMVEQLVNVIKLEPEQLSTVVPNVDRDLEAIIHKALAREPKDRYESAQAMREALLVWANRDGDVRVAEIGAIVSEVFAKKREEVSAVVRTRLALDAAKEARGEPVSAPELFIMDESSERSMPSSLSSTSVPRLSLSPPSFTPHAVVQGTNPSIVVAEEAPSSKRTVTLLIACLMVLFLVVGGLAGVIVSNARAPAAAAAPPAAPAPETTKIPTAASTAPASAAVAEVNPPPIKVATAPTAAAPTAIRQNPTIIIPSPRVTPAVAPTPTPQPVPHPTPTAASPEVEQGYLTLDTYPWTKVSEGGKVLGTTPLVRVPISAGTHVLTLENTQDNIRQTTTVVVKPNENVSKRLAF